MLWKSCACPVPEEQQIPSLRSRMTVRRFQLFELEDLTWFPPTIRNLATDYLHFMEARFALHRPIVPLLRKSLAQSDSTRIVDLCSGGGEPVLALYEALAAEDATIRVTLTDKYPNLAAFRSTSSTKFRNARWA